MAVCDNACLISFPLCWAYPSVQRIRTLNVSVPEYVDHHRNQGREFVFVVSRAANVPSLVRQWRGGLTSAGPQLGSDYGMGKTERPLQGAARRRHILVQKIDRSVNLSLNIGFCPSLRSYIHHCDESASHARLKLQVTDTISFASKTILIRTQR